MRCCAFLLCRCVVPSCRFMLSFRVWVVVWCCCVFLLCRCVVPSCCFVLSCGAVVLFHVDVSCACVLLCVSAVPSCGAVVVVLCCRVVWCCCIVSCRHVVLCCCVMLCCAVVIPASTAPAAASHVLLLGYVRLSETAVFVAIPFEEFYQDSLLWSLSSQ